MTVAWITELLIGKNSSNLPYNLKKVSSLASDTIGMDSLSKYLWIVKTSFQQIKVTATMSLAMFYLGLTASRVQLPEIMGRWL